MLIYIVLSLLSTGLAEDQELTELRMPGVKPEQADLYLCTALRLDTADPHYLVGFTPHGSMKTAHHILLYGCLEPGTDEEVWNCGEMQKSGSQEFKAGPVCASGSQIIYAWAMDAPELKLPKDVGFKVGGDTGVQYLVVQVHYMHKLTEKDNSGVTLHSTTQPLPKLAGVMLMVTGGVIGKQSSENFETACYVDEDVVMHPFAFRTHTHHHGKVVSGYRVRGDKWTLIGKKSPQEPQMFYPVQNDVEVRQGDIVAANCYMVNDENRDVYIGSTTADEMCNFYMMYWVDGENLLQDNTCSSPGPPYYYWSQNGGLTNVPADFNKL